MFLCRSDRSFTQVSMDCRGTFSFSLDENCCKLIFLIRSDTRQDFTTNRLFGSDKKRLNTVLVKFCELLCGSFWSTDTGDNIAQLWLTLWKIWVSTSNQKVCDVSYLGVKDFGIITI